MKGNRTKIRTKSIQSNLKRDAIKARYKELVLENKYSTEYIIREFLVKEFFLQEKTIYAMISIREARKEAGIESINYKEKEVKNEVG